MIKKNQEAKNLMQFQFSADIFDTHLLWQYLILCYQQSKSFVFSLHSAAARFDCSGSQISQHHVRTLRCGWGGAKSNLAAQKWIKKSYLADAYTAEPQTSPLHFSIRELWFPLCCIMKRRIQRLNLVKKLLTAEVNSLQGKVKIASEQSSRKTLEGFQFP
jgi:hypothetical protein